MGQAPDDSSKDEEVERESIIDENAKLIGDGSGDKIINEWNYKLNECVTNFIPFPESENLAKFRVKIIKIIFGEAAVHFRR